MSAPKDIDLGGVLVDPFVRYLFPALIILIAVRFVLGRLGLRSIFANPPPSDGGPLPLHPRFARSPSA
jgi:hypothetical protein